MAVYHPDFEQRSARWFEIRLGVPTASEMDRILTPGGKPSKQADAYMNRLLAEWVLGEPITSDIDTPWMEHGREYEEAAVRAFEFQTDLETSPVGFVTTDDGLIGCSPDRLVGEIGTLELKCPAPNTHIGYLLSTSVADDYRVQNQAQMWICEREKSWVSSYHPKMPPIILPIDRDEKFIAQLSSAVRTFVDVMLQRRIELETRFGPFVRPEPKRTEAVEEWLGVSMDDVDAIIAARG
jgi:YqaJ-like recombinase protein